MKPARSIFPFAVWMLRAVIILSVYFLFFEIFLTFEFQNTGFLIATGFILSGVLLFAGGFARNNTLTILSALALAGLTMYKLFNSWSGLSTDSLLWLFILGVSVFFFSAGNKG